MIENNAISSRKARKRSRITREMEQEMIRLRGQRKSITDIAESLGIHRQTVRTHLKERKDVILADEAKKQVLVEALREHFKDLSDVLEKGVKKRLAPSIQRDYEMNVIGISTREILAAPIGKWVPALAGEWKRMYEWSSREAHLLNALREHTRDSSLWYWWDKWQKEVKPYRDAGWKLRSLLLGMSVSCLGFEPSGYLRDTHEWSLGCGLLGTSGEPYEEENVTVKFEHGNIILGHSGIKFKGDEARYSCLARILEEVKNLPEWSQLESETAKLKEKDKQVELWEIHSRINSELEILVLKRAFPGRCHLCPI